jgi:hypothetical protein
MKVIALIAAFPVVDHTINHFLPTLIATKPPPPYIAYKELLLEVDNRCRIFFVIFTLPGT